MSKRVCPWWLGYLLASPIRRLLANPRELLQPYIRQGMTVLEPGPGMGFFTLELARLVGPSGRVIALDVQPRMLAGLRKRIRKARLSERVDARTVSADSLALHNGEQVDFTLAFAVVHEMPSSSRFFAEVASASKPKARVLLVEPAGHVKAEEFEAELADAALVGFTLQERPAIKGSHAALLQIEAYAGRERE